MTDFSDMLSKAKAVQEKMKEAQDQIKKIEVEGEAGGNLVKVILTGDYELKSIIISDAAKKENQEIINRVVSNYPGHLKLFLRPMTQNLVSSSYQDKRSIVKEINTNPAILTKIKEGIYCDDGILAELDALNHMDIKSDAYQKLYQKVIQVGEFNNS